MVHHGDLYEADFDQFKGFDLLLAGTCCFAGDELVLTSADIRKYQTLKLVIMYALIKIDTKKY